jgi:hypothetical protein
MCVYIYIMVLASSDINIYYTKHQHSEQLNLFLTVRSKNFKNSD